MKKEKQSHIRVYESDKIVFKKMRQKAQKKTGKKIGEAEAFKTLIRKKRRKRVSKFKW